MLYQWFEGYRIAATGPRVAALMAGQMYEALPPPLQALPASKLVYAASELTERLTREWDSHRGYDIDDTIVDGEHVAVREVVVRADPFCDLLHFERDTDLRQPRLLVVAPMSGHWATLLRGTVEALLPEHDVYITDWRNARDVPLSEGTFDLDDYIDYMIDYMRMLGPDLHVLAVCQPGVPVLAAVSLMAQDDDPLQPLSMTLMAAPIDGRQNPTVVNRFAACQPLSWFDELVVATVPAPYAGAGRRVHPGKGQLASFVSLNVRRHTQAHVDFFWSLVSGDRATEERHRSFYDEYLTIMDLPGEYFLQTIDRVFQRSALATGEFEYRGRLVEPSAIRRVALMTIEGERDEITGRGQTEAAHDICTNIPEPLRRHHTQFDVGHYGVFNGRYWREETMPAFREFVRDAEALAHA